MDTPKTHGQCGSHFETFAFLELMGHRKLAGLVQEVEIAGGKFLRIDVPDHEGKLTTQFYSPSSVYCITPTTEAMVKAYAAHNAPRPVSRFELTFTDETLKSKTRAADDEYEGGDGPLPGDPSDYQ